MKHQNNPNNMSRIQNNSIRDLQMSQFLKSILQIQFLRKIRFQRHSYAEDLNCNSHEKIQSVTDYRQKRTIRHSKRLHNVLADKNGSYDDGVHAIKDERQTSNDFLQLLKSGGGSSELQRAH